MANAVNWFEIPVTNIGRAVEFYGTVLGEPLGTMDGPDGQMHIFIPYDCTQPMSCLWSYTGPCFVQPGA